MIAVKNVSRRVTDADASIMTRAVASQLLTTAAKWGLVTEPMAFYTDHVPPGAHTITIFDDPDQADTLGWHEDYYGRIDGKVFASPVLDHGGHVLRGNTTVASVLSHEAVEMLVDPTVNRWAENFSGTEWALEACDPVENDSYEVTTPSSGERVTVSNYVLPSWFDPNGKAPFDRLGKCKAPFQMTKGGYVVTRAAGQTNQTYARGYPQWKGGLKPYGRTQRRLGGPLAITPAYPREH